MDEGTQDFIAWVILVAYRTIALVLLIFIFRMTAANYAVLNPDSAPESPKAGG